jgi:transcriptional repressor NrdR
MQCPYCSSEATRVLETRRDAVGVVLRRRACTSCGARFGTTERVSTGDLFVRKRNGEIEPFKREKIARGITKAASVHQRLSLADVDAFIDRIVDQLTPEGPGIPVSSEIIGQLVLQHLEDSSEVTDVARIRYAMVFLGKTTRQDGFSTASDLADWLSSVYGDAPVADGSPKPRFVIKRRGGTREPFDPQKLERSIGIAAKGRGGDLHVRGLATSVAARVVDSLTGQAIVTSQQVAAHVLAVLRELDDIAYLRYASRTKPYASRNDFWLEIQSLVEDK